MFRMKSFGYVNKPDLTNMNMNDLLGQGRIRREILAHILMF